MSAPLPSMMSDQNLIADPYDYYRRLHDEAPVHWDSGVVVGAWLVSRHADVSSALKDPGLSADRSNAYRFFLPPDPDGQRVSDFFAGSLAFKDPPAHTRLRSLINRAFTPRAIEALRTRAERLVDDALDAALARGRMEVMKDLAYPLPVTIISEMLGVPTSDLEPIKRWTDDLTMFLGVMRGMKRAIQSAREEEAYLLALVAERRARPKDDMLSALAQADVDGDRLTDIELVHMAFFLLIAGHHTTMNLIGNGLLTFLRLPAELARLRADPSLAGTAVEEALRFESPVQSVGRIAKEDMEIGGKRIEAGQLVLMMLGAANRDATHFEEPATFDITRTPNRHVAFGGGGHFCVGAPLTRLEGQIVFSRMATRVREMALADEREKPVSWVPNLNFRGLATLDIELR